MKKLLLPSALILVLGLGVAFAQNISKSVQLSQDATGAIGYDTSNNVYFPAHILSHTAHVPTVSAISGNSGTAATIATTSSDFQGSVTGGGISTGGQSLIFRAAYLSAPNCTAVVSSGTASALVYTTATTGINISSILGNGILQYICSGTR